jgi:hypothetical protein
MPLEVRRLVMKPSPRRWLMISLAFWATVINYLDRQTLRTTQGPRGR